MSGELREELTDILNDLQNGFELCAAKGMAGYDLSGDANAYIRNLLKEALEGKHHGAKAHV